ncbi:MAG TPA: hypothetical protein VGV38_17070 [Pyrinomonadaceae bacterium]|nr:hypothetical protein [Pyrinomonadaceae bacterium]
MRRKVFPLASVALAAAASALLFFGAPSASSQQQTKTDAAATAPKSSAPADKPATAPPAANDAKAEQIVESAVAAVGGQAFLGVRTILARGYYAVFKDGVSLPPSRFTDYLAFPDRNRTEFKGGGVRHVNTFAGNEGWFFLGDHQKIVEAKPEQVKDFQITVRTSYDNVLRGWWRKEGARLSYVGRREAGLAKRNEVVRLSYPDGFSAEFEFGAKDSLPYKVRYKRQNAEGEEFEEEDRFAQHLTVEGVTLPFIIDHFRAGTQTARINYEKYEFNQPFADTLFARPADVKAFLKTLK